jgi:acyl carrier protein
MALEKQFGCSISDMELEKVDTVQDVYNIIINQVVKK